MGIAVTLTAVMLGSGGAVLGQSLPANLMSNAKHQCSGDAIEETSCRAAVGALADYLRTAPADAEALIALGVAYRNLSMVVSAADRESTMTLARSALSEATSLAPQSAEAWYRRSETAVSEGEAESLLRQAVSLSPTHTGALERLAFILMARGAVEEAVEKYVARVKVGSVPSVEEGLQHAGFGFRLLMTGHRSEAVTVFTALLDLTVDEEPSVRCSMFEVVNERVVADFRGFAFRLSELRSQCK